MLASQPYSSQNKNYISQPSLQLAVATGLIFDQRNSRRSSLCNIEGVSLKEAWTCPSTPFCRSVFAMRYRQQCNKYLIAKPWESPTLPSQLAESFCRTSFLLFFFLVELSPHRQPRNLKATINQCPHKISAINVWSHAFHQNRIHSGLFQEFLAALRHFLIITSVGKLSTFDQWFIKWNIHKISRLWNHYIMIFAWQPQSEVPECCHSYTHSFNRYLLNTYYVLGVVLDTDEQCSPCSHILTLYERRDQ